MKVIFKKTGQIKDVSFGHAVNYLIPQGLAVQATDEAILKLQNKLAASKIEESLIKNQKDSLKAAILSKLSGKELIIKAKAGKNGKLFGAITKKALAKTLGVEKQSIVLGKPIKKIGEHKINLKLGSGAGTTVTVKIEAKKE